MDKLIAGAKGNSLEAVRNVGLYAEGLVEHGAAVLDELLKVAKAEKEATEAHLAARQRSDARKGDSEAETASYPPVSNTGGKTPRSGKPKGGKA